MNLGRFGQLVGKTVPHEYSVLLTISAESVMSAARRILLQEADVFDVDITRRSRQDQNSRWHAGRGGYPRCYSRPC